MWQYEFDDDDKKFIEEMEILGIIKDTNDKISLRSLARAWYDRGYNDRLEEDIY